MESESRMKKIKGNLKRDVQDLLGESANVVTGLFRQGLCTVRGIADRWKAFARDLSGAVENLMKPSFLEGGADAPATVLDPEGQPIVTVMESNDPELPVGKCMTLSEADAHIRSLNDQRWDSPEPATTAKVAIDYMMGGQTDRYWLPLEIGTGAPLLNQMQTHVDSVLAHPEEVSRFFADASPELQAVLHAEFGPQLHDDLQKLSTQVTGFFLQHCIISEMEQQFDVQAAVMPEKKQEAFRQSMQKAVVALRRAANTGEAVQPAERTRETPAEGTPRRSVKVTLREMKQSKAAPRKARLTPER